MTHQTRALSLLLCICLLISFTLCLFSCSGDPTTENRVISVTAEKQKLRVEAALTQGFLEGYTEKKVYLFELPSYFSADTDLSELDPVAEVKPRAKISFTLSVYDGARSRLYSSFLVAAYDAAEDQFIPLTSPMALSNPEAMAVYVPAARAGEISLKGLISDYPSDAIRLGISHTVVDVPMDRLILAEWQKGAVSYVYNGVTRYLDGDALAELDGTVQVYTAAGVQVYLRFRLGDPDGKGVPIGLYLPAAKNAEDYAVNMTTSFSSLIMEGFLDFMAERYAAPAEGQGAVEAFIMGYRVNNGVDYNCAGDSDLASYVTNYERLVRVAHTALTSHNPAGRVYISLDNRRAVSDGTGWDGAAFLSAFREETSLRGDYGWHVACELYAATPAVWEENPAADTAFFTVRNLNTLTDLLDGEKYRDPSGSPRRLLISGLDIPAVLTGGIPSDTDNNRQAASYAYAYMTCVQNGRVEALIYGTHTDPAESPEATDLCGIWTAKPSGEIIEDGVEPPLCPSSLRPLYRVFQQIDTTAAADLSEELSALIGASYIKLESALAGKAAPVTAIEGIGSLSGHDPAHKKASPLYTFDGGCLHGFTSAGNLTYLELTAAETLGMGTLHARFDRTAVCEPMGLTVTLSATELIGAKELIFDLYAGQLAASGPAAKPTVTLRLTRTAVGPVAEGQGELRYEASVSEVKSGSWQTASFDVTSFTSLLNASDEVTLTLLMDYPAETAPQGATAHHLGLAGIYFTGHTAASKTPAGPVIGILIALVILVLAVFAFLCFRHRGRH